MARELNSRLPPSGHMNSSTVLTSDYETCELFELSLLQNRLPSLKHFSETFFRLELYMKFNFELNQMNR